MTITCSGYDPARPCPVECQSQLLLDEFRVFRGEFNTFREELSDWKQDARERLATLESDVKSGIRGNGQPSRVKVLEDKFADFQKSWWKMIGAGMTLWALISLALHFVPWGKN